MKRKIEIYGIVLCLLLLMGVSIYSVQGKKEGGAAVDSSVSENAIAEEQGSQATVSGNDETKAMTEASEQTVSENSAAEVTEKEEQDLSTIEEETEEVFEYADLAFTNVGNTYVNVRKGPTTESEIVGKIYGGAVAQILDVAGENEDWYKIVSGNVEGYIKAEFFLRGEEAVSVMDQFLTRYAKVNVPALNVRKEATTDSARIGRLTDGEKVKVIEDGAEWIHVQYTDSIEGYVAAEYVTVMEEFRYAKSLEEEAKEIAERQARIQRQQQTALPEITNIQLPTNNYTTNEELRRAIVEYAVQFNGNRYVMGGRSLQSGTDCSGFTCYVYAEFGYSISRTPGGQLSGAGRSIGLEEIQPGDIVCFSSNGGRSCTHVALYIGDGQIIHSVNPRRGVQITSIYFEPIIGVRNVID